MNQSVKVDKLINQKSRCHNNANGRLYNTPNSGEWGIIHFMDGSGHPHKIARIYEIK